MNKTQKNAWFSVAMFSLSIIVAGYNFYRVFIFKRLPDSFLSRTWPILAFLLIFVPALILMRKKQSPAEVDFDERDGLIRKRAVMASYTSVWILLTIAILILWCVVGFDGTIAAWIFPFIILEVFFIAMIIYSIAILIQYGREENNHE